MLVEKLTFKIQDVVLSSSLTITISILTWIIILFMFIPESIYNNCNILSLILFNT
jgi:NADH-ubiquinone oxidoreductase chain 2